MRLLSFLAFALVCHVAAAWTPSRNNANLQARRSPSLPSRQSSSVTKAGCVLAGGRYNCEDGTQCTLDGKIWICHDPITGELQDAQGDALRSGDTSSECGTVEQQYYNLPLHVAAIFILLVAALIGVGFPIISRGYSRHWIFVHVFFITKHFGTGVIIATAFIHLLYDASAALSDPCISGITFQPTAQAIAMGGVYGVFLIDFIAMRYITRRARGAVATNVVVPGPDGGGLPTGATISSTEVDCEAGSPNKSGTLTPIVHDHGHHHEHHDHHHSIVDLAGIQAHFDVMLLEAGIVFHSIMVGITIGATGGQSYVPLLIAIVFHQFFEGLGLGSRIAMLVFDHGKGWKRWAMVTVFTLTTPVGVAAGIGLRSVYSSNSSSSLLAVGVLNSISAGILLYAGLVELLAHDFLNGDLKHASNGKVATALISLFLGSILMSILGIWA